VCFVVAFDEDLLVADLRLDTWLDVACLFKTRSEAQKACKLGKVLVNGVAAKPHRDVKIGDEIEIHRPMSRKQLLTVRGLADRHIAKAEARELYEDRTPKPSAEEIEMRRIERLYRATMTPPKRPERDMRRTLRRLKRGE
jgi:ribosome-associated heat shock protein Hsp15